jgi:CDP-4-dehydro-6-deoxyglucose reductase
MSYKVQLSEQDITFNVEKHETILEAALRQGHSLPYGCRNGLCGSCKAKIISGDISYPDGSPDGLGKDDSKQGFALLCKAQAKSDLIIKARTIDTAADIKLRQFPCRVSKCEKLSDDVIRLILELPKSERLQFLAGQYIDILMRDGKRRSFSLANPPEEDQRLELHIRYYDGGLFSEYAFKDLTEKTLLRIEGPLGQFTLHESDRPIIMIAGGTGFAPVKSLIEYSLKNNDQRPIEFYWGARTSADLYLDEMAKQWSDNHKHIEYNPVLSDSNKLNGWKGKTGFVHEAVLKDHADLSGYDIYACGPPPMIKAIVESFPAHGLNRDRLFSDSFEFAAN